MVDLSTLKPFSGTRASASHLTELTGFGPNPGSLRGWLYVPATLRPGAALVVALHGCTQDAAGYDAGTGWSTLAEREGFALLLPEQGRGNNPNGCFNWFEPGDIARGGGEAKSIAAMTEAAVAAHGIDRGRVFVTGLSAGGAMTAVMLATYPELFAGGAIIGGLAYGQASGVPEALALMRGRASDAAGLAASVRSASDGHRGRWPSVSVWHGAADRTVDVANMDAIGEQWLGVHGVDPTVCEIESGPGWTRRIWRGADGRVAVEDWRIERMGHGVPIDPNGPDRLGAVGPYMLGVGISSTAEIARAWGLLTQAGAARREAAAPASPRPAANDGAAGAGRVIEDALRAAGLMR